MSKKEPGMLDELMNWLSDGAKPTADEVLDASDMAKGSVIEELKKKIAFEKDPKKREALQKKLEEMENQAETPTNILGGY